MVFVLMPDRPANSEFEREARRALVIVARQMLNGGLSFLEGAHRIVALRGSIGGVAERDADFDAFMVVESETDHLPLVAQRPLWSSQALAALEPEFARCEAWASGFIPCACAFLMTRFATD
jgi:hypothetical protein